MKFPELPIGSKKALIYYYAVDCDDDDFYGLIEDSMYIDDKACPDLINWELLISHADIIWKDHEYILKYLSISETKIYIMNNSDDLVDEYGDFDSYHDFYVTGETPNHINADWPVLAMPSVGEALLDGWHRLHSYIRTKHEKIPFLFLE